MWLKINKLSGIILLWLLFTSQQCTNSDSCGSYPVDLKFVKVMLVANNIPNNVCCPVLTNINGINNIINIQGSIWLQNSWSFGFKSESIALCAGVPRYVAKCCVSQSNSCVISDTQTPYELNVYYNAYFKSKITIRAIKLSCNSTSLSCTVSLFEGSFIIDPSINIPQSSVCNISYIKTYSPSPDWESLLCNFDR